MLSKFKNYLFYLTLEEFCDYDLKRIDHVRNNISFWDKWLGKDQFDIDFIKETFTDYNNNILICHNQEKKIEGVAVYTNNQDTFYNLILLAKKHNSQHKWLGKKILKKLNDILIDNPYQIRFIVLTDVSDIPNYYTRLGFYLTDNQYLKELLDNFEDDLYVIEIELSNFL